MPFKVFKESGLYIPGTDVSEAVLVVLFIFGSKAKAMSELV